MSFNLVKNSKAFENCKLQISEDENEDSDLDDQSTLYSSQVSARHVPKRSEDGWSKYKMSKEHKSDLGF